MWRRILFVDDHNAKRRSILVAKDDVSVAPSNTVPRISNIVARKQVQKSHLVTDWLKLFVNYWEKKQFERGSPILLFKHFPFD